MATAHDHDFAEPRGRRRLLDRLAALLAISIVAASGGLLAELNGQARAARVAAVEQAAFGG